MDIIKDNTQLFIFICGVLTGNLIDIKYLFIIYICCIIIINKPLTDNISPQTILLNIITWIKENSNNDTYNLKKTNSNQQQQQQNMNSNLNQQQNMNPNLNQQQNNHNLYQQLSTSSSSISMKLPNFNQSQKYNSPIETKLGPIPLPT